MTLLCQCGGGRTAPLRQQRATACKAMENPETCMTSGLSQASLSHFGGSAAAKEICKLLKGTISMEPGCPPHSLTGAILMSSSTMTSSREPSAQKQLRRELVCATGCRPRATACRSSPSTASVVTRDALSLHVAGVAMYCPFTTCAASAWVSGTSTAGMPCIEVRTRCTASLPSSRRCSMPQGRSTAAELLLLLLLSLASSRSAARSATYAE
mmetsp:Transcript_65247/g.190934  ORF Transcript_65247/g.190934 Transcript_65247/m.190934 type:complete len:212 (-) Transcript_65247:355-990(-)